MITWFFGSSSDFSQNMITKLDGDVVQFGRSNVSYHPADIKDWINETLEPLETPQKIIFNINTGMVQELPFPMHDFDTPDQFAIFNKWWTDNRNQLFFKTYLINYLITHKNFKGVVGNEVCYITSQISADHNPEWQNLQLYKTLRAVDYELIWNQRARGINAFGICPAANTRPMEWSDYITTQLNTGKLGQSHWLYGVADTGNGLDFVRYSDWEKTVL